MNDNTDSLQVQQERSSILAPLNRPAQAMAQDDERDGLLLDLIGIEQESPVKMGSPVKRGQLQEESQKREEDVDSPDREQIDDPLFALSDALKEIKVECSRAKDGCPFKQVSIAQIDQHEKSECEFRPVKCKRRGCQLQEAIPWNLLAIHHELECQGQRESGARSRREGGSNQIQEQPNRQARQSNNEAARVNNQPQSGASVPCEKCGMQLSPDQVADHMLAHEFAMDSDQDYAQRNANRNEQPNQPPARNPPALIEEEKEEEPGEQREISLQDLRQQEEILHRRIDAFLEQRDICQARIGPREEDQEERQQQVLNQLQSRPQVARYQNRERDAASGNSGGGDGAQAQASRPAANNRASASNLSGAASSSRANLRLPPQAGRPPAQRQGGSRQRNQNSGQRNQNSRQRNNNSRNRAAPIAPAQQPSANGRSSYSMWQGHTDNRAAAGGVRNRRAPPGQLANRRNNLQNAGRASLDFEERSGVDRRQLEMAYWRDLQLDNDQRILRKRARELEQLMRIIDTAEVRNPELRDGIYQNLAEIRQQHRGIQNLRAVRQQGRWPQPGMSSARQRAEEQLIRNMPIEDEDEADDEERGLTKDELRELPVYEYKPPQDPANERTEDKQCSICMSDFLPAIEIPGKKPVKAPMLRRLKCFHAFHKKCIDEWLKQKSICPLCKVSQKRQDYS